MKLLILAAMLGLLPAQSMADAPLADSSAPAVQQLPDATVMGVSKPQSVPYAEVLQWLDTFDKFRDHAPQASLKFRLSAIDGQPLPAHIELKIIGEQAVEKLEVSRQGEFVIPRIAALAKDQEAVLRSNQKKETYKWRPLVRTPGLADNVLRLGDLRRQCQVLWVMGKAELPFVVRGPLSLAGGMCNVKSAGVGLPTPGKATSYVLQDGQRKEVGRMMAKSRTAYIAPLADKTWSDDTLLVFDRTDEANGS